MEKSLFKQRFHKRLNATDLNQLAHGIFAGWTHVGKDGYLCADPGEVINGKWDAGRMRNREQVEHGVC